MKVSFKHPAPFMKIRTGPNLIKELWAKSLLSILYPKEQRILTHLTFYEKWKLKELASRCTGKVFVEIGSYLGASACFISAGIRKSGIGGRLFCIDTWQNDMMSEAKRDTFDLFQENTSLYGDIIVPLRGYSIQLSQRFSHQVDFLFIDGDHSPEGVRSDVDAWFPKLSEQALVIFHDIGWAEGVKSVVFEIVKPLAKREGELPNLYWAWF